MVFNDSMGKVSGDPFARVGLDEQHDMSSRRVKAERRELSPPHLKKLAAMADLWHGAASEVANLGLSTAGDGRDWINSNRKGHQVEHGNRGCQGITLAHRTKTPRDGLGWRGDVSGEGV